MTVPAVARVLEPDYIHRSRHSLAEAFQITSLDSPCHDKYQFISLSGADLLALNEAIGVSQYRKDCVITELYELVGVLKSQVIPVLVSSRPTTGQSHTMCVVCHCFVNAGQMEVMQGTFFAIGVHVADSKNHLIVSRTQHQACGVGFRVVCPDVNQFITFASSGLHSRSGLALSCFPQRSLPTLRFRCAGWCKLVIADFDRIASDIRLEVCCWSKIAQISSRVIYNWLPTGYPVVLFCSRFSWRKVL